MIVAALVATSCGSSDGDEPDAQGDPTTTTSADSDVVGTGDSDVSTTSSTTSSSTSTTVASASARQVVETDVPEYDAEIELTDRQAALLDQIAPVGSCPPTDAEVVPSGGDSVLEVLRVVDGCLVVSYESVDEAEDAARRDELVAEDDVLAVGRPTTAIDLAPAPPDGEAGRSAQWHLDAIDVDQLDALDVRASEPVKVAVIEGGSVNFDHPNLDAVAHSFAPWSSEVAPSPAAHATLVAGVIAASVDDPDEANAESETEDVRGVAQFVDVLSVPIGDFADAPHRSLAAAINWSVNSGAQVINMSICEAEFHGTGDDDDRCIDDANDTTRLAVERARRAGVALIAAAGNCGVRSGESAWDRQCLGQPDRVGWPARYAGVLAVAGHDANDERVTSSSANPAVDVSAPGDAIRTTSVSGYMEISGTSFATPIVSGAVAVMIAHRPDINPRRFVSGLIGFARDAGAPGPDDEFGHGIMDPMRVVAEIDAADPYVPPPPPRPALLEYPIDWMRTIVAVSTNGEVAWLDGVTQYDEIRTQLVDLVSQPLELVGTCEFVFEGQSCRMSRADGTEWEISYVVGSAGEGINGVVQLVDDPCAPTTVARDLGGGVTVIGGLCLDGWAYVTTNELGDSQFIARYVNERWTTYVGFPTPMCRSEIVGDGAPLSIVDRVNWVCEGTPSGEQPVVAWDGEWRPATERTVRLGQFGQQVEWLQEALRLRGYDVDADGYFGYGTERVVRQFQRDRGLLVDGIAGDEVWGAIGE